MQNSNVQVVSEFKNGMISIQALKVYSIVLCTRNSSHGDKRLINISAKMFCGGNTIVRSIYESYSTNEVCDFFHHDAVSLIILKHVFI
jgi:hypothetical protein